MPTLVSDWLQPAAAGLTVASILVYVLMDGWDLGVGILCPLVARRTDRDLLFESITPFWDANEAWLVLAGMMFLLGFPQAFSDLSVRSFVPIIIMLSALVARAASFEFLHRNVALRNQWEYAFAAASVVATLAQGYILGLIVNGMGFGPVANTVLASLRPAIPVLCGVGLVGGYALLGACWLVLKTRGALQITAREVAHSALILTAFVLAVVGVFTVLVTCQMADSGFTLRTLTVLVAFVAVGLILVIGLWKSLWGTSLRRPLGWAVALSVLAFAAMYEPTIDWSSPRLASIDIVLPIVAVYLVLRYRAFRDTASPAQEETVGVPHIATRRTCGHEVDLHLS
jgi:cytochrome bd ubiquinol oxidase subunit II